LLTNTVFSETSSQFMHCFSVEEQCCFFFLKEIPTFRK